MNLSIFDLKLQYESIKDEVERSVRSVLESQSFILGDEVKSFEQEMASYCSTGYGIGVASGTDALILSLKALDVGLGDEVITTPHTFIATAEAIAQVGARPVFADIEPATYNIDPARIEKVLTKRTKAIMPVHLYGQCADMDRIRQCAARHGLKVVEDCAQAIGAEYKGKRAGSLGEIAGFSFYPSKNLGAYGDGGMIVTNDKALADKVKLLRAHGSSVRYIHSVIGYNSRLDNLQAAILRIKLRHLDQWIASRQKNAHYYDEHLKGLPVVTPFVPSYNTHTYHLYVLKAGPATPQLMEFLTKNGIETRTYYPVPLHLQECFRYLKYRQGDFPEAERATKETLAIPLYPELTPDKMDYIVGKIREYFKK